MQQLLGRVFSHSLKFFILFPIVITVLWFSKHTRINFLLPASGIVDDVLHNGDTLKFSIRTCWPRVQSDPFWSRFLHNFHWCKKQFSKDKRPSGSDRIIRRQTIEMHHFSQSIVVKVFQKLLNCTCTYTAPCFQLFLGVWNQWWIEALALVFDIFWKLKIEKCMLCPRSRKNHSFSSSFLHSWFL